MSGIADFIECAKKKTKPSQHYERLEGFVECQRVVLLGERLEQVKVLQ